MCIHIICFRIGNSLCFIASQQFIEFRMFTSISRMNIYFRNIITQKFYFQVRSLSKRLTGFPFNLISIIYIYILHSSLFTPEIILAFSFSFVFSLEIKIDPYFHLISHPPGLQFDFPIQYLCYFSELITSTRLCAILGTRMLIYICISLYKLHFNNMYIQFANVCFCIAICWLVSNVYDSAQLHRHQQHIYLSTQSARVLRVEQCSVVETPLHLQLRLQ